VLYTKILLIRFMRAVRFSAQLALKLEPQTRSVVEMLAEKEQMSLGEAARELLNAGIRAKV
jgi:tRNA nucleotidyltransferase/poly(A) polymerase